MQGTRSKIKNALTIDVEDYFHVAALAESIPTSKWDSLECRAENNTDKLLELFASNTVNATFFTLGWVAERYPNIVKKIAAAGHEVASHGYSHQLIYNQTPEVFKEETYKSKVILEDIIQKDVIGYRAASYSITNKSKWALDTLCELGFRYDSSIFPVKHDLYGIPGSPRWPYKLETEHGNSIVEFPISTFNIANYKLPIAGGGYFRLFPYWFTKLGLGSINRVNEPFVFYLHPWEVDPEQPKVQASWFSMFRHYNNLDKCYSRLEQLLNDFEFTTVEDVLVNKQLLLPRANKPVSAEGVG
ncbi:XrtA system polysaccharide deacetylase [Alkalimarinus coralli]|uniref:XrtA system polysaccharide deacetylase n=1 Tax=Alkalimarinus coralli TaxID=2935863 RepID=UPI00202AC91A|nr:XrtA system polysaccharide deacetylase [Alkalimarinus coralli]